MDTDSHSNHRCNHSKLYIALETYIYKVQTKTLQQSACIRCKQKLLSASLACDHCYVCICNFLTTRQKEYCVRDCNDLRQQPLMTQTSCNMSSLVMRVVSMAITQRPTGVFTVRKPAVPKSKKGLVRSRVQSRACCFFYIDGVMRCEFVSKHQTVNAEYNCDVLRNLRENI